MQLRSVLENIHVSKLTQLVPIGILASIGAIAYGINFSPAIYSDDWNYLARTFVHNEAWINWSNARPLEVIPFYILINIFKTNINGFYIVLAILNIIATIQLFFIVQTLLPDIHVIALTVAAFFEIYPVVFIHMWLTFINYLTVVCLIFLYAWLLILYLRRGSFYSIGASILCLIFSFSIVEAQLGIAATWCILLFLISRDANRQRRIIALLIPSIVCILFTIWRARLAFQPESTTGYVIDTPLTLRLLIDNLLLGYKVLIWGWSEPISQILGLYDNKFAIIIVLVIMVICVVGAYLIIRHKRYQRNAEIEVTHSKIKEINSLFVLLTIGFIFTAAGYFPFILKFTPNLSSMLSRVNLFAMIGASICIGAFLCISVLIFGRTIQEVETLAYVGAIPLVVLGIFMQGWVQYNTQMAWVEQKQIWNDLFVLVPNITDGTTIYFVLYGNEDRVGFANWKRLPLQGDWDTTGALQILYNNQTLKGDVIYPDIETPVEPTLSKNGIVHYWEGRITPYNQAIFVAVDRNQRHLRIITNLQTEFRLSWATPTYKPIDRIMNGPQPQTEFRRLVIQ